MIYKMNEMVKKGFLNHLVFNVFHAKLNILAVTNTEKSVRYPTS
jgi:hypothetical protein